MNRVELAKGVYWVGVVDWNIRNFHGYSTRRGSTYNAYLVIDEKIALIDTVKAPFFNEMLERIKDIIDPKKIDYIISNHVEMDHSGSLPMMIKEIGDVEVFTSERGKKGLSRVYKEDWNFHTVKEGDELNLGERTLKFLPLPMLHWPDSMATYMVPDNILFSNDAFGQHLASSKRFDDENDMNIIMQEAAKYYANIVMPFANIVLKAAEKLSKLEIEIIGPSHGIIWRSNIGDIVNAHLKWAKGENEKKALVIYDTMWKSTEKMALSIVEGIASEGVNVKLFNLNGTDNSDIIKEVLEAKAIIVGSPTLNNGIFPSVAGFLCYMKGLKPKNKIGAAFGSYGWAGGAIKGIENEMKLTGIELMDNISFDYVPDKDELEKCKSFGKMIANKIK